MINWIKSFFIEREKLGGMSRSPKWSGVRKEFIKSFPNCAVCGRKGTLLKPNEVHHILVFYIYPEYELDTKNLLTLCREHHLEWGHLFSFKSYNFSVREDIENFRIKVKNRP